MKHFNCRGTAEGTYPARREFAIVLPSWPSMPQQTLDIPAAPEHMKNQDVRIF